VECVGRERQRDRYIYILFVERIIGLSRVISIEEDNESMKRQKRVMRPRSIKRCY